MEAFFTFWSANELRRTFFSHLAHAAAQRQTTTETVVNVLFAHYGGYACDEKAATRMCCSWSVLSFLDRPSRGFLPYWFETSAPSDLLLRYFRRHTATSRHLERRPSSRFHVRPRATIFGWILGFGRLAISRHRKVRETTACVLSIPTSKSPVHRAKSGAHAARQSFGLFCRAERHTVAWHQQFRSAAGRRLSFGRHFSVLLDALQSFRCRNVPRSSIMTRPKRRFYFDCRLSQRFF